MPYPQDCRDLIPANRLGVVFTNENMQSFDCSIVGGVRVSPCNKKGYSTNWIHTHLIKHHGLCCYSPLLEALNGPRDKLKYWCPYNCKCIFDDTKTAAFVTKEQMLIHLQKYHTVEPTYQEEFEKINSKAQNVRQKISNTLKQRKENESIDLELLRLELLVWKGELFRCVPDYQVQHAQAAFLVHIAQDQRLAARVNQGNYQFGELGLQQQQN